MHSTILDFQLPSYVINPDLNLALGKFTLVQCCQKQAHEGFSPQKFVESQAFTAMFVSEPQYSM